MSQPYETCMWSPFAWLTRKRTVSRRVLVFSSENEHFSSIIDGIISIYGPHQFLCNVAHLVVNGNLMHRFLIRASGLAFTTIFTNVCHDFRFPPLIIKPPFIILLFPRFRGLAHLVSSSPWSKSPWQSSRMSPDLFQSVRKPYSVLNVNFTVFPFKLMVRDASLMRMMRVWWHFHIWSDIVVSSFPTPAWSTKGSFLPLLIFLDVKTFVVHFLGFHKGCFWLCTH